MKLEGDDDEITLDEGTQNEGLQAEANAGDQDGDDDQEGSEPEGTAEGDGSDAQEGQEVLGEQRKSSRGEVRFQKLSQSAKEASERAANAEKRAQELEQRLSRLEQPRQEQPRGKSAEELALMTPDELIDYKLRLADKRFSAHLGQIQWTVYETGDKSAFESLKATNPLAAKYATEVEQRLQEMRATGQNVDRARLFTYMIGEKALAGRGAAKVKQQAEGQRRIERQTVKSGAAQRSDTQGNRDRVSEQEARAKRLENMTF